MSQASQEFSTIAETNLAVDTYYKYINFKDFAYLSIGTGTLTNVTVTLEASIRDDGDTSVGWYDVTNDIFAAASLSASTLYTYNRPLVYSNFRVKYVTSNATNATNVAIMIKKTVS